MNANVKEGNSGGGQTRSVWPGELGERDLLRMLLGNLDRLMDECRDLTFPNPTTIYYLKRNMEWARAMIASVTPCAPAQPSDDAIRKVWNRTQDPIAIVRAFLPGGVRVVEGQSKQRSGTDECDHVWYIWPETDGLEQKCAKCNAYRRTPDEDKFWKKNG